jgi:uncharacterized protein YndB with AHSA1/START domain
VEFGSIEREIFVEASPEVVFEVVSRPEHLREWWPDDAEYEVAPGAPGRISFGDSAVGFSVVEARPPSLFSFRWTHSPDDTPVRGNSLLVTFELAPKAGGTLLRMTETGFREMGWAAAKLEYEYRDHITGWDHFLPRLAPYAVSLAAER